MFDREAKKHSAKVGGLCCQEVSNWQNWRPKPSVPLQQKTDFKPRHTLEALAMEEFMYVSHDIEAPDVETWGDFSYHFQFQSQF